MALRQIVRMGDPMLIKNSRPVANFDTRLHTLLDDMADTMHDIGGVGLAAVQVGVLRRVVLIEVDEGDLKELINPSIVDMNGTDEDSEGCLSVPGVWGKVVRPTYVKVKALDRHGKEYSFTGKDLLARVICHELDHLDGKLFVDSVTEFVEEEEHKTSRKKSLKRRRRGR
ncbi:peptide deformylase [Clostridia bacterium]|nr:peptide deformylase [Clostridia bacterium]